MNTQIERFDKSEMGEAIKGCPQQITHILETYADWVPRQGAKPPEQVLFLGMGGSAISGDLVRIWSERLSTVPMVVVRGYDVPNWAGRETLVLASSYSGNTEETLSATHQAAERGCQMVGITSDGQLAQLCQSGDWDFLQIPGGLQPRAAIGYSLAGVVVVLTAFKVLPVSVLAELAAGTGLMETEGELWSDWDHPDNEPLQVSRLIGKRLPIVYGVTGTTEALAIRLRGQLAENSKIFASHHVFPEQNHNEIVGLAERIKKIKDTLIIWLSDDDDHPRVKLRQELVAKLLESSKHSQSKLPVEWTLSGNGESLIQRNLSLLHKIDWLSYYAALLHDYDPSAIKILVRLKQEMKPAQD